MNRNELRQWHFPEHAPKVNDPLVMVGVVLRPIFYALCFVGLLQMLGLQVTLTVTDTFPPWLTVLWAVALSAGTLWALLAPLCRRPDTALVNEACGEMVLLGALLVHLLAFLFGDWDKLIGYFYAVAFNAALSYILVRHIHAVVGRIKWLRGVVA